MTTWNSLLFWFEEYIWQNTEGSWLLFEKLLMVDQEGHLLFCRKNLSWPFSSAGRSVLSCSIVVSSHIWTNDITWTSKTRYFWFKWGYFIALNGRWLDSWLKEIPSNSNFLMFLMSNFDADLHLRQHPKWWNWQNPFYSSFWG